VAEIAGERRQQERAGGNRQQQNPEGHLIFLLSPACSVR
jgi:hypothetical protein